MSLATRCTSCGTIFRVVQDQLKVSEGWVRCGRCNEVFNALEGLFDLERDARTEWTGPAPLAHKPEPSFGGDLGSLDEPEHRDPSLVDKIDAQLLSPRRSGFGALAGLTPSERRHEDFADARFDTDLPAEPAEDLSLAGIGEQSAASIPGDVGIAPDFVREADEQARWRGSRARSLLVATIAALTLTLVVQIGHHHRDRLAAQWSPARTVLGTWCDFIACTIGAPRRIDDVVVESTSLTRAPVPEAFRLAVVLRNRATLPLAVPWIDLSLTDAGGQLVARRALSPQDFHVTPTALAAGSELALQTLMSVSSGRVTGYTVEIFYP